MVASLIDDLSDRGIGLSATCDVLRVAAPVGAIAVEERLWLAEHKADVIAVLSARAEQTLRADVLALAEARGWP